MIKSEITFWDNVRIGDDCWEWSGTLNGHGYGKIKKPIDGKFFWLAHRYSYTKVNGEIPEGLGLDHLCRNRKCVNPDHLEPVTQRENNRRGYGFSGRNSRKTHCPQGHPYDEDNTRYSPKKGTDIVQRFCKECDRASTRAYYRRQKDDL